MLNLINNLTQTAQVPPVQMEIYSGPGVMNGSVWDATTIILTSVIAVAIASLVIWISWTRIVDTIHVLRRGSAARDLFLKMRIKINGNSGFDSYLRYVDRREADIVSTAQPVKGQRITLVMGSLPGFPEADLTVGAQVVKVRPLGGSPAKFLIVVRFGPLEQKIEQPLLTYIHSLVSPGRVYS